MWLLSVRTSSYYHGEIVRCCLNFISFYSHLSRSVLDSKSAKEELYRHLSVEVGEDANDDTWTVERGLKQFFQPEKRDLKCEKCKDGTTATQTMEIISW